MLNFNGKPLQELGFEETIDYEKSVLKKLIGAGNAGMSAGLIEQIQLVLVHIRDHKADIIARTNMGLEQTDKAQREAERRAAETRALTGEPEPEPDQGLIIGETKPASPTDIE